MNTKLSNSQAWAIYYQSPMCKATWEYKDAISNPNGGQSGHGLLLPVCAHCGHTATRQTYTHFWEYFHTLIQDYVITALVRCPNCHKYNKFMD